MKSVHFVDSDISFVAAAIAGGAVAIQAFGNFYAIVSRPEQTVVRRVNLLKGRPAHQVGSIVTTRPHIATAYDWSRLPPDIDRQAVTELMDSLLRLGPFGFRGPAAAHLPGHLTAIDAGVRTTQVISPGYACPSNRLIDATLAASGQAFLYVTSANRSHSLTGAAEEPAHYAADALAEEFADETGMLLVRHRDEAGTRARYPVHAPMSTTVLAFHKLGDPDAEGRPTLVVERHGSLHLDIVGSLAARHGFGLEIAPGARRRLLQRDYQAPPDTGHGHAPNLAGAGKTA